MDKIIGFIKAHEKGVLICAELCIGIAASAVKDKLKEIKEIELREEIRQQLMEEFGIEE